MYVFVCIMSGNLGCMGIITHDYSNSFLTDVIVSQAKIGIKTAICALRERKDNNRDRIHQLESEQRRSIELK